MEVEKHAYPKKDPETNSRAHAVTRRVKPSGRHPTYLTKLAQLFLVPRIRRAMMAAVVCMISQQLCGVNVSPPALPQREEKERERWRNREDGKEQKKKVGNRRAERKTD